MSAEFKTRCQTQALKAVALALTGLMLLALAFHLARRAMAAPAPRIVLTATAYERAAVQCRGTVQSGGRCRRVTRAVSGYCHWHQRMAQGR